MKPQDVTLSQRMMQTGKHGYFQVPTFLRMWIPRDFDVEERPQEVLVKGSGLVRTILVSPRAQLHPLSSAVVAHRFRQQDPVPGSTSSDRIQNAAEEEDEDETAVDTSTQQQHQHQQGVLSSQAVLLNQPLCSTPSSTKNSSPRESLEPCD